MYCNFFKRIFDITFSLLGLAVFSPLFLMLSLLLAIAFRGKPFFFQERPGKNEKAFQVIKFKSMNDKRDLEGTLLPNNVRTTPLGNFIRKWSLDELPQLINVLTGDMSLVGPRPLLFKYIPLYSQQQQRRHEVRPGITGWAQVKGRNTISWTKKFEYDVWYVDNISFLLDLKIIWLTIVKVIKKEGVNASAEVTMAPFNGTN